jgi:glycosyltransferase involved in cell wall biosynthesis
MISVIVPVYNVKPYLRKCLDSIINQTYRDLEILIIDDGSTDGSGDICDEYRKDDRIKVFHTENRGLSAARNLGLDNTTGNWIGFIDSDDWIEPDMYEVLLRKAEETRADIIECGCYADYTTTSYEHSAIQRTVCGIDAVAGVIGYVFAYPIIDCACLLELGGAALGECAGYL